MWMFDEDLDDGLEEIDEAAGAWDADPVDPAFTAYEAGGADHGGTGDSETYGAQATYPHLLPLQEMWKETLTVSATTGGLLSGGA